MKTEDDRVQVIVRLDRNLVKRIDHLAVDLDVFRQTLIESLLREALQHREDSKR